MLNYSLIRFGLCTGLLLLLHIHNSFAITFFDGTFQQAVAKADKENKKLLIYFTAKWCGPCRFMETEVFNTDSVTRITQQQFIAFKVDFDAWVTKPLTEKYRVDGLPSFVIVDSLEAVERRAIGRSNVSEFVRFLTPATIISGDRPVFELRSDETRYVQRQREESKWKVELGVQAGVSLTQISNVAARYKTGYDISLLVVCTKRRMSIRPGLSLMSIGGRLTDRQPLRLQYVALPINLSYLLRRTVVLGLPGGYRANFSPYVAKLLNSPDLLINSMDYGTKVGLSAFIGDTSRIEAQLGYQIGMRDIGRPINSSLYNRGLYFSATFVL